MLVWKGIRTGAVAGVAVALLGGLVLPALAMALGNSVAVPGLWESVGASEPDGRFVVETKVSLPGTLALAAAGAALGGVAAFRKRT